MGQLSTSNYEKYIYIHNSLWVTIECMNEHYTMLMTVKIRG